VRMYVAEFSDRLVGLTGTPEQVQRFCKEFRVFSNKSGEEEDYLIDHSIIMYLIDPDGKFVSYFGQSKTEDEIASDIQKILISKGHLRSPSLSLGKWFART